MQMPQPSEQHQKLHALLGSWSGEETLSPSPWGPGAKATGRCTCRLDLDGFFVIQDYVEEKDGRVSFRGHGIFGYDVESREYTWYWCDSMGFVPAAPARGGWEGDTLTLRSATPRAQGRYTFRFPDAHSYQFRIENSFDGGRTFATFMEASYRKQ